MQIHPDPSEGAKADQQLCDALRASGIEVWSGTSQLRGGDAWDAPMCNSSISCHGASLRRNTSSTLTGSLMVGTPDKPQKEI